jgi:hypothetical protein
MTAAEWLTEVSEMPLVDVTEHMAVADYLNAITAIWNEYEETPVTREHLDRHLQYLQAMVTELRQSLNKEVAE